MEYHIYIGFNDSQQREEIVDEGYLKNMMADFFERYQVSFSMLNIKGGYLHNDGWFVTEKTLYINIIGAEEKEIEKLAKNLSMFMNQESALIMRNEVSRQYI